MQGPHRDGQLFTYSPHEAAVDSWHPGGGALSQVSYGGVQLRGPNPYPILGKTGLRKHTLFLGNPTIPGTRSGPDSKNITYFRENFIIPRTRSGPDSKNIPYFREIW